MYYIFIFIIIELWFLYNLYNIKEDLNEYDEYDKYYTNFLFQPYYKTIERTSLLKGKFNRNIKKRFYPKRVRNLIKIKKTRRY